ncbi:MAG: LPD38 domain-containing protein [Silanimonas sp.]
MGSLTKCLVRSGKVIDRDDAERITGLAAGFRADGMAAAEAAEEAVGAVVAEAAEELDAIAEAIREQLGITVERAAREDVEAEVAGPAAEPPASVAPPAVAERPAAEPEPAPVAQAEPAVQSRAAQEARAAAAQLRERKSQLASELTANMLTAEQVRSWTNRARLLIGEVATSPDFAQELADARRALAPERRAALAGDRRALAEYDNVRDMIGVIDDGMREARARQAEANRLLDKIERRTSTMSLSEREALVDQLAVALDSAEMAYVAAKRIADWRSGNDTKIVKAQLKRTQTLDYLASEGFQQGSFLWQSGDLKDKAVSVKRKFRRALQDRMIDMRDVQEQIERELGITLDDMQNVYRQENLMHGKIADAIDGFRQKMVDPLKAAIKASGLSTAEVERYLWAAHAEERNAKIRSIRPGVDDGSGMTDDEARTTLAQFTPEQMAKLQRISKMVDAIRRNTLETMVASGQIDRAGADLVLASYQNYVPLRGKDGDGEDRVGGTGTGQGISAGRSGVQRALGRKSPPRNILAELVGDSERAIVQAGKAEVGRSLLRLALSYPNKDLWEVEPVELRPKFNESTGEVYLEIVNDDDSSVIVKHNGKPYRVAIKHPKLVAALRNTGTEGMQWVVQYFGAINRWLSAVFTRFNPGFVPVNMARDLLQGVTGVAAEMGTGSAAKVAAYYPGAGWASLKDAREQRGNAATPDGQKTMEDWAREFAEAGGKTGYTAIDDADTMQRKIENSMLGIWEVAKKNKGYVFNTIGEAVSRVPGIKAIEDVNEAIENALRLATYTHLRKDKGWSKDRAAEYAKEMTVNFNRKGTVGSIVNALYLFFNAAVQGSRRTIRLMKHPKVQVVLGSLVAGQWLLATSLGMATFGDDDETLWEKIPDHVKRRSFVIPTGFDDDGTPRWISIPMPFGFNIFPATGGYLANYSSPHWRGRMGDDTGKHFVEALAYTSSTAIDALSPVPIGEEGFMYPTLVGIGVDLARNRDDLDRRIRPSDEFSQFEAPRSSAVNPGTNQAFVFAAKALNRMGGGDDYNAPKFMPGLLDVSPNELEYLFNTFTGGPGTTLTQGWRAAAREVAVGDMAAFDVPVVRAIAGGQRPEQREAARYYDNKDRIERNLERLRDAYAEGGVEAYEKLQQELGPAYADIGLKVRKRTTENGMAGEVMVSEDGRPQFVAPDGSLLDTYRAAKRDVTDINREMRRVFNDRDLGPIEKQRRLIELQRERADALRDFNRQQSGIDAAAGA